MSNGARSVATSHTWKAATGTVTVSSGISTRSPSVRIASTWAGHWSMKVTSSPALTMSAPNPAAVAPVPTIAMRLPGMPYPVGRSVIPEPRRRAEIR